MVSRTITSPANPEIKALVRLRTSRRARDDAQRFVVEGEREVDRALAGGVTIGVLYVCPGPGIRPDLPQRAQASGAEIVEVAPPAFAKASYRADSAGVIALAEAFPLDLARLAPPPAGLLLVLEGLEKPGNVGAIVRTATAAGADAVLVCDPVTDVYNPNAVRASLGAVFMVPLAVGTTAAVQAWLDEHGIAWHASTERAERPYWDADLTGPCALVVGGEEGGLSASWLGDPARTVVIPTPGPFASLNASVAAGLLLFEAVRQRRAG